MICKITSLPLNTTDNQIPRDTLFNWRISKYNPDFRNTQGAYLKNEWTSYSDIGTLYDNQLFTYKEYIKTEDIYVKAILLLINCTKTSSFHLNSLEIPITINNGFHLFADMTTIFGYAHDNCIIKKPMVDGVTRLILREALWGKLEAKNMYVHFGYDYYMYIGGVGNCLNMKKTIQKSGLFVENFLSPYLEE